MRFHHWALEVNDLTRSKNFYEKHLGFSNQRRVYFDGGEIIFLEHDDLRLELYQGKTVGEVSQRTHFCFEVDNLAEKMKEMQESELEPFEGPFILDNGWKTIFYLGPDHEVIEFLEVS